MGFTLDERLERLERAVSLLLQLFLRGGKLDQVDANLYHKMCEAPSERTLDLFWAWAKVSIPAPTPEDAVGQSLGDDAEGASGEANEQHFDTLEHAVVMLAQMASAHHQLAFGDNEFPSPPTDDDMADLDRLEDWMGRVAEHVMGR